MNNIEITDQMREQMRNGFMQMYTIEPAAVTKEVAAIAADAPTDNVHFKIKLAALNGNTHIEHLLTDEEMAELMEAGYSISPGLNNCNIISWK